MTIGIYCLQFEGTDKVYIGQSVNIERRLSRHLYTLSKNEGSRKLQEAYNTFGKPTLEIVLICTQEELDTLEQEAIDIYNSIAYGFNTSTECSQPPRLHGEDNGSATHSNASILEVFNLLIDFPKMYAKEIKELTGVSISTIRGISAGTSHSWISKEYPDRYKQLMGINRSSNSAHAAMLSRKVTGNMPPVKSPTGEIYKVDSLRAFSATHNLDRKKLADLLRGNIMEHRGWVTCL